MRILYATDGSDGALEAGRFLVSLPFKQTDHIHIVTFANDETDRAEAQGRRYIEAARNALGPFPGQITTAVTFASVGSTSKVVKAILGAAGCFIADLIAIGAQGQSSVPRFPLGSIAEGTARHSDIPVLIARPGNVPLQKVVMGLDRSQDARDAACWVNSNFPLPPDCELRLVQAIEPPFSAIFPDLLPEGQERQTLEEWTPTQWRDTRQKLQDFATELAGQRVPHAVRITLDTMVGSPAVELERIIEREKAGMVVVGSHGLTGIKRLLLGSVSTDLVHHAPCSVLVIHHAAIIEAMQGTTVK
jgi:nucleotide-binding universal stress UspA family protein